MYNYKFAPIIALTLFALLSSGQVFAIQDVRLVDPSPVQGSAISGTLNNIEFRKLSDGRGELLIEFDSADYPVLLSRENKLLHLNLPGIKLGEGQLLRLNVTEFTTPIQYVESFRDANQSSLIIEMAGDFNHHHEKDNEQLRIVISEVELTDNEARFRAQFSGEPISLDFQDVPVRQVLQIIAQVNGFNLVTTDTVTGNVTINLSNVPWDQALSMILRIKGLDQRMEGNILLVAPSEEMAADRKSVV